MSHFRDESEKKTQGAVRFYSVHTRNGTDSSLDLTLFHRSSRITSTRRCQRSHGLIIVCRLIDSMLVTLCFGRARLTWWRPNAKRVPDSR